ncbi:Metal tolerance protein C4 [Camellia lanceoleosa]|uniref:Metal tolerance protein C4 n=1 Tax=Camellia lanceoleosa TaxID=1840588 RepID=A0ACC0H3L4_9ERIC|nr:Metal tolerance protein C4 [Camellia lanceoleosa]
MEELDGVAVIGLLIAAASLVVVNTTGNAIYDPTGSIIVGNILGMEAMEIMVACSAMVLAKKEQSKEGDNQSIDSS